MLGTLKDLSPALSPSRENLWELEMCLSAPPGWLSGYSRDCWKEGPEEAREKQDGRRGLKGNDTGVATAILIHVHQGEMKQNEQKKTFHN